MRSVVGFALVACVGWSSAGSAQTPGDVAVNLWNQYEACAKVFMANAAKADPAISFEQREPSLRPACGHHVETIRTIFMQRGLTRNDANKAIGPLYRQLAVTLRGIHADMVGREVVARAEAAERIARQEAAERAARQEAAERAARQARDARREADADQERQKLVVAARDAHTKCIADAVVDFVSTITEGAEAIATAAVARCQHHESLRVQMGIAIYRVEREFAVRTISEDVAKMRTQAVSAVVELRAAAARARQEQGGSPAPSSAPLQRGT